MPDLAGADHVGKLAGGFDSPTQDGWRALAEKALKGRTLDSLHWRTADGLDVAPLYTDGPDEETTGAPGAAPYTRSFEPLQHPDGRWDIRAEVDGPGSNKGTTRAVSELERGATSLRVGGAALASAEALASTLDGVDLELAPVVLAPAGGFADNASWLMDLWSSAGLDDRSCRGGFGVDPVGLLAATGRVPQGIDTALAAGSELAAIVAERFPGVRAWSVDSTSVAEAGAGQALEIAAVLSTSVLYLRAMADLGIEADAASSGIEVTLGADADFFTTIAKIRAARRTYAAMATACGIDPGAAPPSIVVRTLRRNLTRRDPWVNMLRVTSAAFAAALGGADSVITSAFDSVLGEPSEMGRRVARNTQLLLAEESNVGRVVDPAGGSWYVENLTESIAIEAWDLFRMLEGVGGMPGVLLDGTLAARIARARDERFEAVATRKAPITGVSEFPNLREELPRVDPYDIGDLISTDGTDGTDGATTCEPLVAVRWAEPFEALRDAADAVRASTGELDGPRVFLANLGSVATHTARSSWARNFFEAGGLAGVTSERGASTGFASPQEAAEDFTADGARLACICSTDDVYGEQAGPTAAALQEAGAERVYLAGNPAALGGELHNAGVDAFVHVGVDVLEVLEEAHEVLGIGSTLAGSEDTP